MQVKKPTVALITSHTPSLVHFRAPLISMLQAQGIQVLALAPNFDERSRAAMRQLGAMPVDCPMVRTGMNPLRDAVNTLHMFRLLRSLKPDMCLGYFIKPVIFGSIAARLAGVPRRFAMIEGLGHPVIHISPKNISQKPNLPRVAHKTGRFARCERFSAVFGQLHGRAQYTQEWSRCKNLSVSY